MKVENMKSPKTGMDIPNQFIIIEDVEEQLGHEAYKHIFYAEYFQSYNSIIVKRYKGIVYLDKTYWNYSRTTSKYRNIFLGETTKETQAKINSGEYVLTDLN